MLGNHIKYTCKYVFKITQNVEKTHGNLHISIKNRGLGTRASQPTS